MRRFPLRAHRLAITALIAPAIALVGARVAAWLVGIFGLAPTLPVGVHTYVPLLEVIPLGAWVLVSAAGILVAMTLALRAGGLARLGRTPVWSSVWRGLLQLAILGALAQLLLFAAQLIVVGEVQGVADGASALLLAGAGQAILSALLAVGGLLLSQLPLTRPAPLDLRLSPLLLAAFPVAVRDVSDRRVLIGHPRRGPPLLPIT